MINETESVFFELHGNNDFLELLEDNSDEKIIRNLRIEDQILISVGFNYMIFKLTFEDVKEISKGGVQLEDALFAGVKIPELFFF